MTVPRATRCRWWSGSGRRWIPAAAAVVGLLAGCTGGRSAAPSRGGSDAGGPTARLVYRVTDTSGPTPDVTTVVQEVAPPYRGRTLTYQGEGTTTSLGGVAWTDGGLYTIKPDGTVEQNAVVIPGEAGVDSRLALTLPVAEAQQLVSRAGHATVLGVSCTQWQSKEPLDSGAFAPAAGGDRATSCVDAAGRILKDVWFLNGVLVRTRVAIEASTVAALDDNQLFGGQSPAPAPAGIGTEEVKALTGPADHDFGVHAVGPPPGLVFDGAVALRDNVAGETAPIPVRVGQVVAYRRGQDLVVIRRLVDLVGRPSLPALGAFVDLGRQGRGRLEATYSGLVVSFVTHSGVLVTVTGSIPESDLLAWVSGLQVGPIPN